MDNELEIVPNNDVTVTELTPFNGTVPKTTYYLGMAAGAVTGLLAGYTLCKFVVGPLLKKMKDKKAANNATVVTGEEKPKTEEA